MTAGGRNNRGKRRAASIDSEAGCSSETGRTPRRGKAPKRESVLLAAGVEDVEKAKKEAGEEKDHNDDVTMSTVVPGLGLPGPRLSGAHVDEDGLKGARQDEGAEESLRRRTKQKRSAEADVSTRGDSSSPAAGGSSVKRIRKAPSENINHQSPRSDASAAASGDGRGSAADGNHVPWRVHAEALNEIERLREVLKTTEQESVPAEIYKEAVEENERLKQTASKANERLSKAITCIVCCELMANPYTLGCGHTSCFECLFEWFEQQYTCPMCRERPKYPPVLTYSIREAALNSVEDDTSEKADLIRLVNEHRYKSFGVEFGAIRDDQDGVNRCSHCGWEVVGDECVHCGTVYGFGPSDDMDDFSDGMESTDVDTESDASDIDTSTSDDSVGESGSDSSFSDDGYFVVDGDNVSGHYSSKTSNTSGYDSSTSSTPSSLSSSASLSLTLASVLSSVHSSSSASSTWSSSFFSSSSQSSSTTTPSLDSSNYSEPLEREPGQNYGTSDDEWSSSSSSST